MSNFQNYRANVCVLRNGVYSIEPGADDFLSVALPAQYQLGGSIGAAPQPIEVSSDRSGVITVTCGAFSLGHATMALAHAEQEVARRSGVSPVATHRFELSNGDTYEGEGVIAQPQAATGGTAAGTRAWTVVLSEVRPVYAVGLVPAVAPTA